MAWQKRNVGDKIVQEKGRTFKKSVVATVLCAALLESSAVLAGNAPGGQTIPGINMSAGQPTAGSIRSGMAGKRMKGGAPQILKFKINALGRL